MYANQNFGKFDPLCDIVNPTSSSMSMVATNVVQQQYQVEEDQQNMSLSVTGMSYDFESGPSLSQANLGWTEGFLDPCNNGLITQNQNPGGCDFLESQSHGSCGLCPQEEIHDTGHGNSITIPYYGEGAPMPMPSFKTGSILRVLFCHCLLFFYKSYNES